MGHPPSSVPSVPSVLSPSSVSSVSSVLFDLDDTLFDHMHATRQALAAVRATGLAFSAWTMEELERRHSDALETLHAEVLAGRLTIDAAREERFRRLLTAADGQASQKAAAVARLYRESYQQDWRAVPGAAAVLAWLKQSGTSIAVVTNNLTAEQRVKLVRCGLDRYVDQLVTSEDVGVTKPDPRIFHAALAAVGKRADEAVVVGDAWHVDIAGARAAGIRAVWFNRLGAPSLDPAVPELRAFEPLELTMAAIKFVPD
jgi:HAD superfamily hydrolase (TIGR01509 family)